MAGKGYEWDTRPCHAKIKELRQGYQKARESNCRSGAQPKTCHFYKELKAILGSEPTSTAKRPMDTSAGLETADTGLNPSKVVVNKEIELEDDAEQGTGLFGDVGSQDLVMTSEGLNQSQPSDMQDTA